MKESFGKISIIMDAEIKNDKKRMDKKKLRMIFDALETIGE